MEDEATLTNQKKDLTKQDYLDLANYFYDRYLVYKSELVENAKIGVNDEEG